jgi:tetratricopeptide (TPR) repeat protein
MPDFLSKKTSGDVTVKEKNDGIIVTGTVEGDINIGYTIEQHESRLKEREREIRAELEKLHRLDTKNLSLEKQNLELEKYRLERELSDVQAQLQDEARSYQEKITFLQNTIEELRAVADEADPQQLQVAIEALQQGETDKADRLFQQIEERERSSIEHAAKAAFERGKIAEDKIDYRNAYRHYERAVGLSPENPEDLETAGSMANTLAMHRKAVEWEEKALALYLQQGGEDSADVARLRNNLGGACKALGQYEKAIGYYEQALASDLKTYGEDHPDVARDRNNLGLAWKALGHYEKAIDYYEQALAALIQSLGVDHPYSKQVAENLKSAKNNSK